MPTPSELERYRIAFAVHFMQLVIAADGVLDYAELTHFGAAYPEADLIALGMLTADGQFTDAFHNARIHGALTLPEALDLADKLDLLVSLHELALADGALAVEEYTTLRACADRLGVPPDALSRRLDDARFEQD